jgi:hypothetical protein
VVSAPLREALPCNPSEALAHVTSAESEVNHLVHLKMRNTSDREFKRKLREAHIDHIEEGGAAVNDTWEKVDLTPVAPIVKRQEVSLVTRADGTHGFDMVDLDEYPHSEEAIQFYAMRHGYDCTLREAANLLGVSVSEVSGLECGRFKPTRGWEWFFETFSERASLAKTGEVKS